MKKCSDHFVYLLSGKVMPLKVDPMEHYFGKVCTVVIGQRQIIFLSCLNCVLNLNYDICLFKR